MPLPHRSRHVAPDGASLRDLLASIVADCGRAARQRGLPHVDVVLDVSADHVVPIAAAPLRRLLESLVRRALESAAQATVEGDGPVVRELLVTSIDVGGMIEIEVADSGADLPQDVREWLSGGTEEMPAGAGLALAAVRAAAERIGGTVRAVNCAEGGAAVTIRLPGRRPQRLAA